MNMVIARCQGHFCGKLSDSPIVIFNTGLAKSLEFLIEHENLHPTFQTWKKYEKYTITSGEKVWLTFFQAATVLNC